MSVYVQEGNRDTPVFMDRVGEEETISDISFMQVDVKKKLRSLKLDKFPGPEGIHTKLLKECAEGLTRQLYIIFQQSLQEGKLPDD